MQLNVDIQRITSRMRASLASAEAAVSGLHPTDHGGEDSAVKPTASILDADSKMRMDADDSNPYSRLVALQRMGVVKDFQKLGTSWEYIFWYYKEPMDQESIQKISKLTKGRSRFVDIKELDLPKDVMLEFELQYRRKLFNCIADSLRLHILAIQGGLYLDTDIELKYNVTKFAYQTKMLMISHPMFLFHHFMLVAPNYKPELLLNVTNYVFLLSLLASI